MKKLIFTICLCVLVTATGQTVQAFQQGATSIGGTVSFKSFKYDNDSLTQYSLSLAPQLSLFLWDNICIDGSVLVGTSWGKGISSSTGLGFGLGGRYFYKQFYGGLFLNYTANRNKSSILVDGELVYGGYNWRKSSYLTFKLGRLFGISKNVFLDLGMYYKMGIGKITNSFESYESRDNERKEFGTFAGISIFI